jgi:hypothetical protein
MSEDPVRQENPWKSMTDPKWDLPARLARFHMEDVRKQRALLSELGFNQSIFRRRFLPGAVVWVLVLAFLGGIWWVHDKTGAPTDYATAIIGMVAFVFGFYQWRSSRYEKSMEDFYSRLNLANQRRESTQSARLVSTLLGQPWESNEIVDYSQHLCGYNDHLWSMYVYAELDNLEYVVEKYNLGYMEPRPALRGLRTFYQRCLRKSFRERAWHCVLYMAYNESTIKVVAKIFQVIEEQRKEERRKAPLRPQVPGHGIVRRGPRSLAHRAAL